MHRRCSSLPETLRPPLCVAISAAVVEVNSPSAGGWGSLPVLSQPARPPLPPSSTVPPSPAVKKAEKRVVPTSESSGESVRSYRTRAKKKSFIEDGGEHSPL